MDFANVEARFVLDYARHSIHQLAVFAKHLFIRIEADPVYLRGSLSADQADEKKRNPMPQQTLSMVEGVSDQLRYSVNRSLSIGKRNSWPSAVRPFNCTIESTHPTRKSTTMRFHGLFNSIETIGSIGKVESTDTDCVDRSKSFTNNEVTTEQS